MLKKPMADSLPIRSDLEIYRTAQRHMTRVELYDMGKILAVAESIGLVCSGVAMPFFIPDYGLPIAASGYVLGQASLKLAEFFKYKALMCRQQIKECEVEYNFLRSASSTRHPVIRI